MLVSLREPIEVPYGRLGCRTLMALTARPPRRGNDCRFELAMAAIRHFAAQGFYDQNGYEDPDNPRGSGKRSRQDRRVALYRVFSEFRQGVAAGRMFLSSLYSRYPEAARAGHAALNMRFDQPLVLRVPTVPHGTALANIVAEQPLQKSKVSDASYVRQSRWDNWLPTIHIGASYALLIDANAQIQGPLPWAEICRAMLFRDNLDIVPVIVSNANMLLEAAEERHFFPKAKPRPLILAA